MLLYIEKVILYFLEKDDPQIKDILYQLITLNFTPAKNC